MNSQQTPSKADSQQTPTGSPMGVRWESAGSPLGVQWEFDKWSLQKSSPNKLPKLQLG